MISHPKSSGDPPISLHVLVVEDEPVTSQAVQRFLEYRGHKVTVARRSSEAVRFVQREPPDVLVCDWKLAGDEDGVELAQRIRSRYEIPVILVTAHRLAQARQKARDIEVTIAAFRRKPLSLPDLAEMVESMAEAA